MLLLLIVFIPHFVIFCFHCYYYPSHPIRFDLSTRRSIICQVVWNCTRPSSLYLRDKQKLWAPIFLNNNFEENNQLGKRQRLVWKLRDRKTFYLFCAPFQKTKQISFHRVSITVVKVSPFLWIISPTKSVILWVFSLLFLVLHLCMTKLCILFDPIKK